jgi:hypothetical protein
LAIEWSGVVPKGCPLVALRIILEFARNAAPPKATARKYLHNKCSRKIPSAKAACAAAKRKDPKSGEDQESNSGFRDPFFVAGNVVID